MSSDIQSSQAVLQNERREYSLATLTRESLQADPIKQFERWLAELKANTARVGMQDPTAMVISTVNQHGMPSQRTVLLKGLTKEGFVFYTNYDSAKAQDIAQNPQVCLLFSWLTMERQVKVQGVAKKLSAEASKSYFYSRPVASQLAAIASPQSRVIASREYLDNAYTELEEQYRGKDIPMPENWGGYVIKPLLLEFWQGGEKRLHDRFIYRLIDEVWQVDRLAP